MSVIQHTRSPPPPSPSVLALLAINFVLLFTFIPAESFEMGIKKLLEILSLLFSELSLGVTIRNRVFPYFNLPILLKHMIPLGSISIGKTLKENMHFLGSWLINES